MKALLDLGYGRSLQLTPAALKSLSTSVYGSAQGHLVGASGNAVTVERAQIAKLGVGRTIYENVEADVVPSSTPDVQGVVGRAS